MSAAPRAVYPWPVASPTLDEKRKLLAAVPFFGGLTEKELEALMQLGSPSARVRGDGHENAQLTRREPNRAKSLVVDPAELAAQEPCPSGQTLAPDVAHDVLNFSLARHVQKCICISRGPQPLRAKFWPSAHLRPRALQRRARSDIAAP